MGIKHSTIHIPNDIVASADWNADHIVDGNTGEVLFVTAGGNVGADANLFWDNTNKRLGVGTNTPSVTLEINGNILASNFNVTDARTFVGVDAGTGAIITDSTCIGYDSGDSAVGEELVAIGIYAGWENNGSFNTFIGSNAGDSNTGSFVTGVGYTSLYTNLGDYVSALGYYAGFGNTGNNVVAIGYEAGKNNATANQFILKQTNVNAVPLIQGDFSTGNVAIGKTSAGSKLAVVGLPIYANNAAAITGGLAAGDFYRTGADPDPVMVVH